MIRLVSLLIILTLMGFNASKRFGWTKLPADFPEPRYDLSSNRYNVAILDLGRNLFYDPRLSANNTISCASCHSPYNAFAHTDHALSHGLHDSIGFRNAPALFNLAWHPAMMWDGAIHHLDVQALAPLTAPNEMGSDLKKALLKINREDYYKQRIKAAFGDTLLHGAQFLKALAQFQLSLISDQSRYDSMRRKQVYFTKQEQNGYQIFKQYCNRCHREPLFSTYAFERNGISFDTVLNDIGRARVSHLEADKGLFKIPSLRNTAYTFPYMHDGRYKHLREVIRHYVHQGAILGKPMTLNSNEQTDLLAFLRTLNDRHFVFDSSHTFPKALRTELEGY